MTKLLSKTRILTITIILSGLIGLLAGLAGGVFLAPLVEKAWHPTLELPTPGPSRPFAGTSPGIVQPQFRPQTSEEQKVVAVVRQSVPAVVSVVITKDLPVIEQYFVNPFGNDPFFKKFFGDDFWEFFRVPEYRQKGTEKRKVGAGTGFIVSEDGLILTNKHVVSDTEAEYTVILNDERKFEAQVLARDPVKDLAILKIKAKGLSTLPLGDSARLQIGQTVIAIGNALGKFSNTVSKGVISGLSRSVTAYGPQGQETLLGVIQTDAAINQGNSGGPLLNLKGEVIGVNTAMAGGAENIGFAIPINDAKKAIDQVKRTGKIIYPFLGVRYITITPEIQKQNNLPVDYGALILRGEKPTDLAIIPGSPADKAGLSENDIILEFDGQKITSKNPLAKIITQYKPGDTVNLKILHKGKEKIVKVKLAQLE